MVLTSTYSLCWTKSKTLQVVETLSLPPSMISLPSFVDPSPSHPPYQYPAVVVAAAAAAAAAAEIRFLDDMLGESGDNVASLLEKAFDLVPGSFPLAMPHATEQNTSPLTGKTLTTVDVTVCQ